MCETMAEEKEKQKHETVVLTKIDEEMKHSFLDYSMSVIVSRALPDVRDGLKPVHRRVLYGMYELSNTHDKPYKKSARVVGDVMGKYHPHGDLAIYDTIVRMAQNFSLRYTLVDGQGNFGSVDGDGAAAMRYTEIRMEEIAEELLADLDKDTVDFVPNFDETLKEPTVLPAKLPNLLINGSSGIAVGMATNIPPHNLSEVVDGTVALIDNPALEPVELLNYIKGPDFPTGAFIYGRDGIKEAYLTGRGSIRLRAKTEITEENGKTTITGHGNPLHGEQGQAHREHRRAGQGQEDRRHLRPARRVRPGRHAHRHRAQAGGQRQRAAEPAVQAHADGDDLRREQPLAGRQRADDAGHQGNHRLFHQAPAGSRDETQPVRAEEGRSPRAHPGRPAHRAGQHRRFRPDHPGVGERR